MENTMKMYITADEVAELLGVSRGYHYNNGEFVLDRYYDRLTDYATGIVASNVDIYDASGRIVFKNNQGIKNINKAAVSGLKPQYTYTGKGITPSVTVSVDGITLKKDTDYSLSYKNNKNVGTATISIKGKGKYTGTKNLTFTIVKIILQNQTIKVNSSFLKSYSANGTFKLNATAKGKLSYKSSNTKVVTVSSKGVVTIKGTGNAVITVKAGKVLNKYNAASKNVKIKIVLKNKNMYVQPYKGVSLKSKASLTGKKVTAIPYAGAVEVKSYSNGWAYVTYKGKKGYIQEKNLGDVKPVPASSDKLLTQYSNQMSYRLVDFTKKFSKNAYRSNVTATSTEQLKKLGNMINVYASSQIIEKDKKEILEAFADAVLQAILNSNINKYETNQKKMLDQISSQIKGGLKSGSKKVTVSSGKTYTVDFNIAAQSYGGIGATVSWAYVTYGSQRYTLVISSTSEQIDAVLASYCTALAQLNTDCWKDFMSAYITGGWKLSGLNANYKLTDQKVRTYLDRSELLIRAIAGDEKAKTKLLESGSKDMKDKLKDIGFCHFYHCVHNSTGLGSVWCIAEQPVFAAYCKRADRIFAEIIRKTAAAIFQIGGKIGSAVLNVGDSFIHPAPTGRVLLIKPRQKAFYYRLFFFKTRLFDSIEGRIL